MTTPLSCISYHMAPIGTKRRRHFGRLGDNILKPRLREGVNSGAPEGQQPEPWPSHAWDQLLHQHPHIVQVPTEPPAHCHLWDVHA